MRARFVLAMVMLALAVGVMAGALERRLFVGALVIGFVPAVWGVSRAFARRAGSHIWRFTAPYPYRWMRERSGTAV